MIEGGCFCRAIRFAIEEEDYLSANCHCTMCRRVHAAPYVTWIVVGLDKHRYTAGQPSVLRSSGTGTRYFCSQCGTHVACINARHPEIIDIPVGSLDHPERFQPGEDIFDDTRLPWLTHPG